MNSVRQRNGVRAMLTGSIASVGAQYVITSEAVNAADEVLLGTEWLSEKYGVDIICRQILLAKDSQYGVEYPTSTQILPAPELELIPRRPPTSPKPRWKDWDTAKLNRPFEEVKTDLQQALKQATLQKARQEYLKHLR